MNSYKPHSHVSLYISSQMILCGDEKRERCKWFILEIHFQIHVMVSTKLLKLAANEIKFQMK